MSRTAFDYLKVKQILETLKKKGEMTLVDLSRELRWSYVTVRRYVEFMKKEGLVKVRRVVRGNRVVKILVSAK